MNVCITQWPGFYHAWKSEVNTHPICKFLWASISSLVSQYPRPSLSWFATASLPHEHLKTVPSWEMLPSFLGLGRCHLQKENHACMTWTIMHEHWYSAEARVSLFFQASIISWDPEFITCRRILIATNKNKGILIESRYIINYHAWHSKPKSYCQSGWWSTLS